MKSKIMQYIATGCLVFLNVASLGHAQLSTLKVFNGLNGLILLPQEVHLGMTDAELISMRTSVVQLSNLFPNEKNISKTEKETKTYIEQINTNGHLKAAVYFFRNGKCTAISVEERYEWSEYPSKRLETLMAFKRAIGSPSHFMREIVRENDFAPNTQLPCLLWEDNASRVALTIVSDSHEGTHPRAGMIKARFSLLDEPLSVDIRALAKGDDKTFSTIEGVFKAQ